MSSASLLARVILALVFLWAGVTKIGTPSRTRQMLLDFGLPRRLTTAGAWLLPLAELGVGVALVPAAMAWWGAVGALVLLLLFLVAIAGSLARGRRPVCRCFGHLTSAPIGWASVLRNLVLAGVAGAVVLGPEPVGFGASVWRWPFSGIETMGLGIVLALGALTLAEGWLLLALFQQHGRLLLRLDELESRLQNEPSRSTGAGERSDEAGRIGLVTGTTAPSFTLPRLGGPPASLADLLATGKPVLLLFMDPACGPCMSLLPTVVTWQGEFRATLKIAVVSRGEAALNRTRLSEYALDTVLLQADDEVAARYQGWGTPSAVIVGADGKVASPVAQGADAIRRLVMGVRRSAPGRESGRTLARLAVSAGVTMLAVVTLSAAGVAHHGARVSGLQSNVLQVDDGRGWQTWWRADSAPAVWDGPVQAVLDATRWAPVSAGVEVGELIVSGGGLGLRTRMVLVRFDLRQNRFRLASSHRDGRGASSWTVQSADRRAVVAFNAGQFGDSGAWGWVVRGGRELQRPGRGPLSLAVAVSREGDARFVSAEGIPALRRSAGVEEAFQSYPALLVGEGRVPARLLDPGGLIDLGHRDTRLSLCALADGRLLVALTRFDNLGRIFGSLPIGLTLDETAAIAGALGCRRAVSLDGGLSAQLLVRPVEGAPRRWEGWRSVPLGIEVVPQP